MIAGIVLGMMTVLIAAGVIALTWRQYGVQMLTAHDALAACPGGRELRYRIVQLGLTDGGNVVTLPVRHRSPFQLRQPLRAAA